jgi:hypothetical protein
MTLSAPERVVWIDLAEAVTILYQARGWPQRDAYHWLAEKVAVGEIEARELSDRGDGRQGTIHLPKDWLQRNWGNMLLASEPIPVVLRRQHADLAIAKLEQSILPPPIAARNSRSTGSQVLALGAGMQPTATHVVVPKERHDAKRSKIKAAILELFPDGTANVNRKELCRQIEKRCKKPESWVSISTLNRAIADLARAPAER